MFLFDNIRLKLVLRLLLIFALISFTSFAPCTSYAFEFESSPYEGMPVFKVKTDVLLLNQNPSIKSPLNNPVEIEKGSIISFPYGVKELLKDTKNRPNETINTSIVLDNTIQKTVTPGIIKALKNGSFKVYRVYNQADSFSDVKEVAYDKEVVFKKGDTIEYLLYLGENHCLFRYKNEVLAQHGCLWGEINIDELLELKSRPVTEWWISFKKDGKTLGWLKIDDNQNMIEIDGFIQ